MDFWTSKVSVFFCLVVFFLWYDPNMFVDAEESLYFGIWVVKSISKSKSLFFARHVFFRISELWKNQRLCVSPERHVGDSFVTDSLGRFMPGVLVTRSIFSWGTAKTRCMTGWWQLKYVLFSPRTLGRWSNLTFIFFKWVENHQLDEQIWCKEIISTENMRKKYFVEKVLNCNCPYTIHGVWYNLTWFNYTFTIKIIHLLCS